MTKPIFSILTPTFNCAQFILRSYHSLVSQTNKDWEWIVINDGSVDETKAIVNSISDSRIKFLSYEVNRGRGFARNLGLSKCTGDIVVVWDVDDLYMPERLQYIYDAIIKEDYDFFVSKAILVDNFFRVKGTRGVTQSRLFKSFVHPTLAFKTSISDKINYDQNMRAGEDLLPMIKLTTEYNGKYLDVSLMLYFEDREINLNKTIQMHRSHTSTIYRLLNDKDISASWLNGLIIKSSLFLKKIVLNGFLLNPSIYLNSVKFRDSIAMTESDKNEIYKIVEKIKIEYANL